VKPVTQVIAGADSWRIANDVVEAFLTVTGGHLAPVRFHTPAGLVQPFALAPWSAREVDARHPRVLRHLRGDFFCLPFGGNATAWRGERHPVHGETACGRWRRPALAAGSDRTLFTAELRPGVRPGIVTKRIELRRGQTAVYCEHEIRGMRGPMCLGHHAMLRFDRDTGPGRLWLGRARGQVCPQPWEDPAQGGYSCLRPGARFSRLDRVPLAAGGQADLTRFPAREGFEDLVLVTRDRTRRLAWTTVTFPAARYLWFACKDPRQLASTVLWHSHGGRHYPPWNGRHRGVLGLEEVTAYFHHGLAASARPNALSRRGIPTVLRLDPERPTRIRCLMGVAAIPRGFDVVREVRLRPGGVEFLSVAGPRAAASLDLDFLTP